MRNSECVMRNYASRGALAIRRVDVLVDRWRPRLPMKQSAAVPPLS